MTEPMASMFHEPEELAALYVAGALSDDECRQVDERLKSGDAALRRALESVVRVGDILAAAVAQVSPPPSVREKLMRRIAEQSAEDGGIVTLRASDAGAWRATEVRGVFVRTLCLDRQTGRRTQVYRMEAGSEFPEHPHEGVEEIYLLEGDLRIGDLVLHPGDYQRAAPGSHHDRTWTVGGCVMLVVAPLAA